MRARNPWQSLHRRLHVVSSSRSSRPCFNPTLRIHPLVSTDTLRRSATHRVPALASDVWQKWIRSSLTLLASAFAMVFVAMVGGATVLWMVRRWPPSSLSPPHGLFRRVPSGSLQLTRPFSRVRSPVTSLSRPACKPKRGPCPHPSSQAKEV